MVIRSSATVVALILTAFVALGCGSDGAGSGGSGKTKTSGTIQKSVFVSKANAICRKAFAKSIKLVEFEEGSSPTTLEGMASDFLKFNEIKKRTFARVRSLGLPDEDQETLKRWFKLENRVHGLAIEMMHAVAERDAKRFNAIDRVERPIEFSAKRAANAYGIKDCITNYGMG